MHPLGTRHQARQLFINGVSIADIGRQLDLPYWTVRDWVGKKMPTDNPGHPRRHHRCFRCRIPAIEPDVPEAYCYLLGQYLGDGYLATQTRIPVLRIACADAYPGIKQETRKASLTVLAESVQVVQKQGCAWIQSYSTHWPCVLPQHGPGMKHTRPIRLEDWQLELVERFPEAFLRGLIHSDGSRVVNHTSRNGKRYEYPRYHFSNRSADIHGLCGWAMDLVGVEWRMNNRWNLSVARRRSVALLDSFIGPKR